MELGSYHLLIARAAFRVASWSNNSPEAPPAPSEVALRKEKVAATYLREVDLGSALFDVLPDDQMCRWGIAGVTFPAYDGTRREELPARLPRPLAKAGAGVAVDYGRLFGDLVEAEEQALRCRSRKDLAGFPRPHLAPFETAAHEARPLAEFRPLLGRLASDQERHLPWARLPLAGLVVAPLAVPAGLPRPAWLPGDRPAATQPAVPGHHRRRESYLDDQARRSDTRPPSAVTWCRRPMRRDDV